MTLVYAEIMKQMGKTATISLVGLAFILFFVVLPGWVFIPVIPALILLVVGVLSENGHKRTRTQSSTSEQKDEHRNDDLKAA